MKIKDLVVGQYYAFGDGLTGRLQAIRMPRKCWNSRSVWADQPPSKNDGCLFVDVRYTFDVDRGIMGSDVRDKVVPAAKVERPEEDRQKTVAEARARLADREFANERAIRLADSLAKATGQRVLAHENAVLIPVRLAQSLLATIDAGGPLADEARPSCTLQGGVCGCIVKGSCAYGGKK